MNYQEAKSVSGEEFREAFSRFPTAVSIVSTDGKAGRAGLTCSAVFPICDAPPTLGVCVNRNSEAFNIIKTNGVICVSCLHSDQQELSQIFAGFGKLPWSTRFEIGDWNTLTTGAPYNNDAVFALDCVLVKAVEVGSHSILIGEITAAVQGHINEPLVYHQRNYTTVGGIVE